jgi:RHS repeat-associated protein
MLRASPRGPPPINRDRHRANTKEEDPTGLLNEGFRYRDMETGTFISRDPLGLIDGPNVYAYVSQNPWSKFDPDGLTGWALPPQYAESAEYREGFHKGMAEGAKLGLTLAVGVVATVVAELLLQQQYWVRVPLVDMRAMQFRMY